MTIGCLFGTFDPPHLAHVAIAEHMRRTQGLDAVWLVVSPQNPFKADRRISPEGVRLAMVRLAVQGHPGLEASDFEFALPRPSYTARTLQAMRGHWPQHRFVVILGSDNIAAFNRWESPDDILAHHRILVYPRGGEDAEAAVAAYRDAPSVTFVRDAPRTALSSTAIRAAIAAQRAPVEGLDPQVAGYIAAHGLYQG
jgi:nicotinate-nucleotide adenylyltransferase